MLHSYILCDNKAWTYRDTPHQSTAYYFMAQCFFLAFFLMNFITFLLTIIIFGRSLSRGGRYYKKCLVKHILLNREGGEGLHLMMCKCSLFDNTVFISSVTLKYLSRKLSQNVSGRICFSVMLNQEQIHLFFNQMRLFFNWIRWKFLINNMECFFYGLNIAPPEVPY